LRRINSEAPRFAEAGERKSMNDYNQDLDHTDEEILRDEVSDDAVEAASIAPQGLPTLMHNTYCFACPATIRSKVIQQRWGAEAPLVS
jgi:hypothetical protein